MRPLSLRASSQQHRVYSNQPRPIIIVLPPTVFPPVGSTLCYVHNLLFYWYRQEAILLRLFYFFFYFFFPLCISPFLGAKTKDSIFYETEKQKEGGKKERANVARRKMPIFERGFLNALIRFFFHLFLPFFIYFKSFFNF